MKYMQPEHSRQYLDKMFYEDLKLRCSRRREARLFYFERKCKDLMSQSVSVQSAEPFQLRILRV